MLIVKVLEGDLEKREAFIHGQDFLMPVGVVVALAVVAGIATLVVAGAFLLYRGWTGASNDGHPRCTACHYDLHGHGLRPDCCPECAANLRQAGAVLLSVREFRSRSLVGGVVCIVLAMCSLVAMCFDTAGGPAPAAPVAALFIPARPAVISRSASVQVRRPTNIGPAETIPTAASPWSVQSVLELRRGWATERYQPDEVYPDAVAQDAREVRRSFADVASQVSWGAAPSSFSAASMPSPGAAWNPVMYAPRPLAVSRATATPYSTATRAVQRADVRVSSHTAVRTSTFHRAVKARRHGR